MAWRGFRNPLETKDLWSMNPEDTCQEVVPLFDKYWEKTLQKTAKYVYKITFFLYTMVEKFT